MDVHARQDQIRRQSRRLVAAYVVVVLGLSTLAGLGVDLIARYIEWTKPPFALTAFQHGIISAIGAAFALVLVVAASVRRSRELRAGGIEAMRRLGGRPVARDGGSLPESRLINVVDEMALAAQMPAPPIFILDREPGVNACALAWNLDDAALCVTSGSLYRLKRDELQAMIAHEMAQLADGDTDLNLRMAGMLHGIQGVLHAGLFMMFPGKAGKNKNRVPILFLPAALAGLALVVFGSLGYVLGNFLRAAATRRRELQADAEAVLLTRNSDALVRALRSIGGFAHHGRLLRPALGFAHMFFVPAHEGHFEIMDSHPPLANRIRAIDSQWDGSWIQAKAGSWIT